MQDIELGLIKTQDGHFIASHHWEHWTKISGYTGQLPPTLNEFQKQKIHNKYTPLDFDDINRWFSTHKDAILVTDKIDDPKTVISTFTAPSRLRMELFSKDSALEAGQMFVGSWLNFYTFKRLFNSSINQYLFLPKIATLKKNNI